LSITVPTNPWRLTESQEAVRAFIKSALLPGGSFLLCQSMTRLDAGSDNFLSKSGLSPSRTELILSLRRLDSFAGWEAYEKATVVLQERQPNDRGAAFASLRQPRSDPVKREPFSRQGINSRGCHDIRLSCFLPARSPLIAKSGEKRQQQSTTSQQSCRRFGGIIGHHWGSGHQIYL
jgi:hypothetical protein